MNAIRFVAVLVFAAVAGWGIYGFGSPTLTERLAQHFGISFRLAAFVVSLLVVLLAAAAVLPWAIARKKDDGTPNP